MITARIEPRVIPTYRVGTPEKNPVFFEKRVYQGSNGKVYPVPFIDKIFDDCTPVTYRSALLENDYVRLVMLPEIGGRIFLGQDKTNDDYDFFYRQDVIKPALVGLAGPWISGGVEFNWPQHHRPGTFMPTDVFIEADPDGAHTVWMSEHDPVTRLKGMHGVRLRPDSSLIELRVRLYNRTPNTRSFLWWANVAAQVHDRYQSFFPPDVNYVADHAVRAISSFPIAENSYYGVDYQNRPGANDLSWYKNIPVPTSYMVCETSFDFFGGYDYSRNGGFVHVANRHIAPGKKQWTWGNEEFGWAWDRELTDRGGPYVELMAGVYTDNQPDFSYLLPYETKAFSQFWWPIQNIGPVQQANQDAALACTIDADRGMKLELCVSRRFEGEVTASYAGQPFYRARILLRPGESWKHNEQNLPGEQPAQFSIELCSRDGRVILAYRPVDRQNPPRPREVASEPPAPSEIQSSDELFLTGEHLELYRHPTRDPEPYWEEAIARDPGDSRCHLALGKRYLDRGEFSQAREHFLAAIARLTRRHPNPISGEAHYHLGLVLRWLGDLNASYQALYKATWNSEWRSPAYYQLAAIDCRRSDWATALDHLEASLDTNRQHNKARVLQAIVLHHLAAGTGPVPSESPAEILEDLLSIDPLDLWAFHVLTRVDEQRARDFLAKDSFNEYFPDDGSDPFLVFSRNDAQTILDLVFDYSEAGFYRHAIELLVWHHAHEVVPVAVPNPMERSAMTHYVLAWLKAQTKDVDVEDALGAARSAAGDYFFPSRLEEMIVLQWAVEQSGVDPLAAYGLGNFLFDKRRHADAIGAWERAASANHTVSQVDRNLGIAYWNNQQNGAKASASYARAIELSPCDARLICEYDQLAKKRNRPLAERLAFLEAHRDLVLQRDDVTVELASLYNATGRAQEALDLVTSRRFHPWEGGEGAALRQYTNARLLLGQAALERRDPVAAYEHFSCAMDTPRSLGEAYHPLQAKNDVNYWIGRSLREVGRDDEAAEFFRQSAEQAGDFSEMTVATYSPLTYYRGLSLRALGRDGEAEELFRSLSQFARSKLGEPAKIDYFATSLPNLLVFAEDLQARRDADHRLLLALASYGLGDCSSAQNHLDAVLAFDQSNQHAIDLQRQLKWPATEEE